MAEMNCTEIKYSASLPLDVRDRVRSEFYSFLDTSYSNGGSLAIYGAGSSGDFAYHCVKDILEEKKMSFKGFIDAFA